MDVDVWRHTMSPAAREELSVQRRASAASLPVPIEVEAGRAPEAVWMCLETKKISDRDSYSGLSSP